MPWISFDFDGTLAAWPFHQVVVPNLLRQIQHPDLLKTYAKEASRRLNSELPHTSFDVDDIFLSIRDSLEMTGTFPTVLETCNDAAFPQELVYPDVPQTFSQFREQGWRIAVSSNAHGQYQKSIINKLGITADVVLTADDARAVKPQARFLQALPEASGDANALTGLIHVGDRLLEDVLGAQNAGVRSAWLWREMPTELRGVPLAARVQAALDTGLLAQGLEQEAKRDGRFGFQHSGDLIIPDFLIAQLDELPETLCIQPHSSA